MASLGKEFFIRNQKFLRWFANTDYGKDVLYIKDKNTHIDTIMPNYTASLFGNEVYKRIITDTHYTKRLYKEYKIIWEAMHWFDEKVANIYVPKLNLGFDSLSLSRC